MILTCSNCHKDVRVASRKKAFENKPKDYVFNRIVRCNKCGIILGQYTEELVLEPWYGAKLKSEKINKQRG